jgi:hypothetical protein
MGRRSVDVSAERTAPPIATRSRGVSRSAIVAAGVLAKSFRQPSSRRSSAAGIPTSVKRSMPTRRDALPSWRTIGIARIPGASDS